MGFHPRRLLRAFRATPSGAAAPPLPESDELEAVPPLACTAREVERWNAEWIEYLKGEWEVQLTPYTVYPDKPPLPESPLDLIHLRLGYGPALAVYCRREDLEGR